MALSRRNSATNCEGPGFTGTYPGAVSHEISTANKLKNRLSAPGECSQFAAKTHFNAESFIPSIKKCTFTKSGPDPRLRHGP
jgi:hypothetical protein